MTIGEIKLEAMNLMFARNESLDVLEQDENYRDYMYNLTGAINRCFSSIEEKRVLPTKSKVLTNGELSGTWLRFAHNDLDIDRITFESDEEYIGSVPFDVEGDSIIVKNKEGTYRLIYYPSIARVLSYTSNDTVIDIPDRIASAIPYYVKGDLYRDDEPDEADKARAYFETAMAQVQRKSEGMQSKVQTRYSYD